MSSLQVARAAFAIISTLTLLLTDTNALFHATTESGPSAYCAGVTRFSTYCSTSISEGRLFHVLIALVVVAGRVPRVSAAAQWWCLWSLSVSARITDGGDQVAANVALLIIPILLLTPDLGTWARADRLRPDDVTVAAATPWLFAICLQVGIVYLHSSLAKFGVADWANGTALYYWLSDPVFGAPRSMEWMLGSFRSGTVLVLATWGVLVVELAVAVVVLIPSRSTRDVVFALALLFHLATILVLGLASFGLIMIAVLLLNRSIATFLWDRRAAEHQPPRQYHGQDPPADDIAAGAHVL